MNKQKLMASYVAFMLLMQLFPQLLSHTKLSSIEIFEDMFSFSPTQYFIKEMYLDISLDIGSKQL